PLTPTSLTNVGSLVALFIPTVTDSNSSATTGCSALVQPFTYRWSLISLPSGSQATLTAATTTGDGTSTNPGTTTFSPDLQHGDYQVSATVTAALGNVSDPQFFTVHSSLCGANPPSVASISTSHPIGWASDGSADVDANFNLGLSVSASDLNTQDGTGSG